jgi:hypothetical protein
MVPDLVKQDVIEKEPAKVLFIEDDRSTWKSSPRKVDLCLGSVATAFVTRPVFVGRIPVATETAVADRVQVRIPER